MYSRYVPNERGGYDRRVVDTQTSPQPGGSGSLRSAPEVSPVSALSGRPDENMRRGPPDRPPPVQRPETGLPLLSGLSGLFRGLELEDLLILAILILLRKEDGADPLEIGISAALYLLLR